jgi:CHASE3 domain sensor protein
LSSRVAASTIAVPVPRANGVAAGATRARRLQLSLRGRATPQVLWLALGATWFLVLVLFIVARSGLSDVRAAAQTIGRDSEPSVLAARQIGLSLANMHASAANALLVGPGSDAASWTTYDQERQTVADTLVDAAQNITYTGEKEQIRALGENFVRYQDLISTARANQSSNPAAAMSTFTQADDLLHNQLFPAANELARINNDALTQSYQAHRTTGVTMAILTAIAGLAVVGALLATQRFLSRRTRRLLNLPLVGATALTVLLTWQVSSTLLAANEHLRSAKQDAYDSIYALTSARAVSYDGNADESLWLLAHDDPRYETSFMAKARQLSDPLLTSALVQASQQALDRHQPVPFNGYLANELNNITFTGEREAALAAATYWANYVGLDSQIRALERSGDHAGAVALDIGTAQGQSDWAFNNFDQQMGQLVDINQKQFNASIQQIFTDLGGATSIGVDTLVPVLSVCIVVLVWFGLQPRIGEYR